MARAAVGKRMRVKKITNAAKVTGTWSLFTAQPDLADDLDFGSGSSLVSSSVAEKV
jgi:hypothetical protein